MRSHSPVLKPMLTLSLVLSLALLSSLAILAQAEDKPPAEKKSSLAENATPKIQLCILLDTSGSMEGLINQARTQIWKIVNALATAKQDGKEPDLQVALFEYGKSTVPAAQGHIRRISSFTDDLDLISEELFQLTTNGGNEYCGQAIDTALKQLKWTDSNNDLKMIFIAGNEPFTQGTVNYKDACGDAIKMGITVNTVFCGNENEGVNTGWKDGAVLADGSFLAINQNAAVAAVITPYDKKLSELNTEINSTFVAYGNAEERNQLRDRQLAADRAAKSAAPATAAERAAFKGSQKYRASGKELVDDLVQGKADLKKLKKEELPQELRGKTIAEQKAILQEKAEKRAELQQKIQQLAQQRKEFIENKRKTNAKTNTLDAAIIKTIQQQAAQKKFELKSAE